MGRQSTNLRDLVGKIKDKASQSKVALNPLSKPHATCLLRATTHDSSTPPDHKYLSSLLSFGHRSRVTASAVIESLMDRLQTTGDASVAIKCLITVHHIIRHGTFILHDQLSIFPAAGGRNYLKLSNFRDSRSPFSWEISSWVSKSTNHLVRSNKMVPEILQHQLPDRFSGIPGTSRAYCPRHVF